MDTGTADIKLRPIKLAFLVEPTDKKAILEAIRISSVLWGGPYNPIIPVFSKTPKIWKKNDPISKYKNREILDGYLRAYDPDFIVPLGKCAKKKFSFKNRKIISPVDILENFFDDGTPGYGVGIFEILRDYYDKELKFIKKEPSDIYFFKKDKKYNLFLASAFGDLPPKIEKTINDDWSKHLDAKKEELNLVNYGGYLKSNKLFIRRFLYHGIETLGRGGNCLFFMDANSTYDIIDYWNLRALGWIVVPIVKQAAEIKATQDLATGFIEEHSGISRSNEKYYVRAVVIKSRSIDNKQVEEFMKKLNIKKDDKSDGSRWVFQHWYPRLWDEWARDKDGAICCELEVSNKKINFAISDDGVDVETVDPYFVSRFGGHGHPRFANVVNMRTFSNKDIFAEVMPEGGDKLSRTIGTVSGFNEWKFSKKESVYFSQHIGWNIHLSVPKAEDVFSYWMSDNGFDIKLSSAGLIAKQMIKRLGGLWGLNILASQELITLLREMENGKVIDKNAFWGRMSQIANSKMYKRETSRSVKNHIDRDMFRLGATMQCPVCSHKSWYPIDQLKYNIQCPNCLDSFDIPTHSPDDIKWAYKTFGPFSLNGAAEGAYSTLLTIRLFAQLFDFPITPSCSFLANIDGEEKEIDFGMLLRESKFRDDADIKVVFGECKTNKQFEKSDVDKMSKLSVRFPGAILVFATLNDKLSAKEIKLIKPLVNKCRRYWKYEQPYNPVLILTKTELFANISLNHAWEDAGDFHAKFGKIRRYTDNLLFICDATQQLYLGMRPWHDEVHEKWEKRRQKREQRQKNINL